MRFKNSGRGSLLSGVKLISEKHGKIKFRASPHNADGISQSESTGSFGKFQAQEITEDHYSLLQGTYQPKKDSKLKVSYDKPLLALVINLSDELLGSLNGQGEGMVVQYQQALFNTPSLLGELTFRQKKKYNLFCISFEPEYLTRLESPGLFSEFLKKVNSNQPALLMPHQLISPELASIVNNIFNPPKQFALSLYREAKVLELLHYIIENINSECSQNGQVGDRDKILLQKTRRYLSGNFSKNIKISDLAKRFQIPGSLINKKFKHLNGVTIQEFVIQERMRKAKKQLLGTKIPLARIAALAGYKNTVSFNRDFEKYNGMAAASLRAPFGRFSISL